MGDFLSSARSPRSAPSRSAVRSMRKNRRKHQRQLDYMSEVDRLKLSGPISIAILVSALVILLWTIGTLLVAVIRRAANGGATDLLPEQYFTSTLLDSFPKHAMELWPDHNYYQTRDKVIDESLWELFVDCLPHENDDCQERKQDGSTTTTIGMIRSPGMLGEVVQDFVAELLEKGVGDGEKSDFVLLKTSHIDIDDYDEMTKIIRPAIVPLLLEAADIAMKSIGDDFHPSEITLDDMLGIIRQLVRWHSRIAYVAADTAMYSVPFDRLLAYPSEIEKGLQQFLKIHSSHHVSMDKYAEKVMNRVDTCNNLILRIIGDESNKKRPRLSHSTTLDDLVNEVMREELEHTREGAHLTPLRGKPITRSRVTDLVGHYLDKSNSQSEKICQKYFKANMCLQDTSGRVQISPKQQQ